MSLSPMVAEWVAAYEQETGEKLTETAIHMAEHIVKVGKMLREQGRKDAQQGRKPCPDEVFPALVRKTFPGILDDAPHIVESIADLWRTEHQEGGVV